MKYFKILSIIEELKDAEKAVFFKSSTVESVESFGNSSSDFLGNSPADAAHKINRMVG